MYNVVLNRKKARNIFLYNILYSTAKNRQQETNFIPSQNKYY